MKRLTKRDMTKGDAEKWATGLRAIDLGLINLVAELGGMSLAAQGQLVEMQRRIRRLRFQVEAECGVDGAAGAPPGVVLDFAPLLGTGAGNQAR